MLEFTATSTERPELLQQSFGSFCECVEGIDPREEGFLYINIDPVPYNSGEKQQRVLDLAREHFAGVRYREGPEGGSFSQAINWLFTQPRKAFFFHLEDDWLFEGTIPVYEYIEQVKEIENGLQCVTMDNGGGNRFHMPPALNRTEMLQTVIREEPVPDTSNPEQHLIKRLDAYTDDYNVTSHGGCDRHDLGREWSEEVGVEKDLKWGGPGNFIKWDTSNVGE